MKAILLAAGKAPFFEGAISNLDVHDEPLLDIQVSALRSAGAAEIFIATGHRAAEIHRTDILTRENADWRATGSLSSLALFLDVFDGESDVLIAYGDTLFDPSIIKALQDTDGGISAACLLDRSNNDLGRYREYATLRGATLVDVSTEPENRGVRTVFTGMIFIKRYRAAMLKEYVQDALQRQPGHLGALLNVMLHHGVSVTPVVIEQGWAELSSDNFYQDVLAREVFLKHVLQIRTDWSARARGYNKLAWVNDDQLLSAMLGLATSREPRRVLDVGTGSAKVLLGLKRALGKGDFWGVDSSAAMLEKITERDGLTLKIGSAEDLEGIPRRYFDLVTARMVFHHIAEVDRAMQAIAQVLKAGGTLVVCEGVPPSMRSVKWYTEMFRYKEDRHTLTETDLVNMFVKNGYDGVHMRTVVMRRASLNNWLDNSGIPQQNIEIIKQMHFDAPAHIVEDYDMQSVDGDCLMTWRFAIVAGTAPD